MELESLQIYWWLLISVLGALLVFLLFVQGGQTFLLSASDSSEASRRMISSFGHKWELTFTTLVVFGGAFFASFPLFYSTSFGGAYWLWMLILISFVLQAVSYEFRTKPGNIFGTRTYDTFLFINGCVGCILLGVAVSMFFFGAEFSVSKGNILDGSSPVISVWAPSTVSRPYSTGRTCCSASPFSSLPARREHSICSTTIPTLTAFFKANRRRVMVNGAIFVVLFLIFAGVLLTSTGLETTFNGGIDGLRSTFARASSNTSTIWWKCPGLGHLPDRSSDGALRNHPLHSCRPLDRRHLVERNRHHTGGALPLLDSRLQQHPLLPLAHRPIVIAYHLQQLIEPLHSHLHELGFHNRSCSGCLHSLCLVCYGPQARIRRLSSCKSHRSNTIKSSGSLVTDFRNFYHTVYLCN